MASKRRYDFFVAYALKYQMANLEVCVSLSQCNIIVLQEL